MNTTSGSWIDRLLTALRRSPPPPADSRPPGRVYPRQWRPADTGYPPLRELFGPSFDDRAGPGVRLCRVEHSPAMLPRLTPFELCSRDDAYAAIWQLEQAGSAGVFSSSIAPIVEWSARMFQLLPASEYGHHSYPGGLFIHVLQGSFWSVSLWNRSHARTIPGLSPREVKAAWQIACCVAFAAHDAGKLVCDLAVLHRPDGNVTPLTLDALAQLPPEHRFTPLHPRTTFDWLVERGHSDYFVQWLPREYRRPHDEHTATFVSRILTDCGIAERLPLDVLTILSTPPPAESAQATASRGDLHALFWSTIHDADRRSAAYGARIHVSARNALLREWLAIQIRTRCWSLENGIFAEEGPNLVLDLGRLSPNDVRAFLQHVQAGASFGWASRNNVQCLADHFFGAGMLAPGVLGQRLLPDRGLAVMLTAPESAPLLAALHAARVTSNTTADAVTPPVMPPPAAPASPPAVAASPSPLPQPVDLRGHAIALPDAPSPAPDVSVGSPQTWRVPVRQFLDHLCQHRIRLLVTDDIQAELELISKDPNQSGVAARRGPSSSTVYVSSARVREIADRMAVPSAVLRAEIREDPGLFGEHVPSSGRSLKWLALAPPASAWILDRAPVNHALQLVSPSAESVQVAQFALQEWQTYLISMHNDFAPYRDRAGSIVFSNALLAHLRVSRDRPTCGLGARQLLNHLQAYGVDGQLRDAGLVLSITDVPSNT